MANCYWWFKEDENQKWTEAGFDAQLLSRLLDDDTNYKAIVKNLPKIFSKDGVDRSVAIVEDIQKQVSQIVRDYMKPSSTSEANFEKTWTTFDNDDDGFEKLHDISQFIGVTEAVCTFGSAQDASKPMVTPFNLADWKNRERSNLKSINPNLSDNDIDKIIEDKIKSWDILTAAGDDVHAIMEAVFKDKVPGTMKVLPDSVAQTVLSQAQAFKAELVSKYGKNAKFYPELSIYAKELRSDIKEILTKLGKENISGTLDLLVIDENGKPHIYDYKVSRKKVGVWNESNNAVIAEDEWKSSKKYGIENQQTVYRCMLEQWGLFGADTFIVPFLLDLEYGDDYKSTISQIKGITKYNTENITGKTSPGNKTYNNWHSILPPSKRIISDGFAELLKKYETAWPTSTGPKLTVQQFEASVEYEKKHHVHLVGENDTHFKDYKYYFYKHGEHNKTYAKDDADLDNKLRDYVNELRDKKSSELLNFGEQLRNVMNNGMKLEELINNFDTSNSPFLEYQFNKYLESGWELRSSDSLLSAGIFIFTKDNDVEIITMTNESLDTTFNLGMGTSLLGQVLEDTYVDRRVIMDASVGNLELMKGMLFVADHADQFDGKTITSIRCINPWKGKQVTALNSVLIDNYNKVKKAIPEANFSELKESLFRDDVKSLITLANDKLSLVLEKGLGGLNLSKDYNGVLEDISKFDIREAITKMEHRFKFLNNYETAMTDNYDVWLAYYYLNQAYLKLNNIVTYNELDPGEWLSKGFQLGINVNSGEYSPSANLRNLSDTISQFSAEVRIEVERLGRDVKKAFEDFFKSMGQSNLMGRKADWYKMLFVTDSKGNITRDFCLRRPDDPKLVGNKAAQKLIETWTATMAKLRWPNYGPNELERLKESGDYYQVPLTEAVFSRQARNNGFWNAVQYKFRELKELNQDVFASKWDKDSKNTKYGKEKEEYNRKGIKLYNKLNRGFEDRQALMDEFGVGFFEYDLENVMNEALVAFTKTNLSQKYIPIIDAMRVSLRVAETYGGQNMENVRTAFDKMVKSKFYGEPIIEKQLQPYARWINVIKRGLSTLQLGFNMRSFVRETLQGTWMGITRSGLKPIDGLNFENYAKATTFVIQEAHKNFSSTSLLQQLNSIYGMANQSLGQLAGQRKLHWSGLRNFSKDTVFLNTTAPDFQHRMSILVGKMMGDGCWEAHSLDENGVLKYDWTKDKRFDVYAKSLKDPSLQSDPKYFEQRALYMFHIEELNRLGFKKEDGTVYKEGDALERAYLPRENQAIKNYADILYGHYDQETKSLVSDMFLGSLFLQYKTYTTSRAEQWAISKGVYNTATVQWVKDEVTGENLYKVHYKDLDSDGMPRIDLKTKDQIEDFDQKVKDGLIEPYYEWVGIPMEGMMRSYVNFADKVIHWDWDKVKDIWNNPIERDNLLLGLNDCLVASLLMMVITGLAGLMIDGEWTTDSRLIAKHARDAGWGPSFAYQVTWGSFQDFPVWQLSKTLFNDWNPSSLQSAKRLVQNTGAVIMGDKEIFQAVTSSVGAMSDFRGIADRLAEINKKA